MSFYTNIRTLLAMQNMLQESGSSSLPGGLVDSLLKPRQKSGKEIMAEALSGRLRSDAAVFRQAGRNAEEGKDIAANLAHSSQKVVDALSSMRELADKAANGDSVDEDAWNEAAGNIEAAYKGTTYNGISLMDGGGWKNDSRLLVTGSTAGLNIHTGTTSQTITLRDYKKTFGTLPAFGDLTDPADASTARDTLDGLLGTAKNYAAGYKAQEKSFESMAKTMGSQSEIADTAAKRTILGSRDDPSGKLLYYLLNEHGKLFDDIS